jgi:dephospho-CoA kinase
MRLIGLTGGIATGKSTVQRMLRELGAAVIDADAVYHELIKPVDGRPSPLAERVAAHFPAVLEADGSLNRQRLGEQVFADAAARRTLEELTHPAVADEVAKRVRELGEAGAKVVFYDVPLLFERELERGLDGVVVVWVPRELQLTRLVARDGLDPAAAEQRLLAQLPIDTKCRRATWIIDNSGTIEATRAQVEHLWEQLSSHAR